MALALKDIENWTLDDLLEAINPPPPSAAIPRVKDGRRRPTAPILTIRKSRKSCF